MKLIDKDEIMKFPVRLDNYDETNGRRQYVLGIEAVLGYIHEMPTVEAIPVWYIIRWYEKRYKLGSTVADDWERGLLKEKIAKMHSDFKNEKYLDNKQESERFAQMVKEVIELYNDWEAENEI